MRILIVEDSTRLRSTLSQAFRYSSYAVDETGDGKEGLWMATSIAYDVIVLDIMLPSMDGLTILKKLRENGCETSVLLLTAKDAVQDRVFGLRSGADDYLVKPFDLEELLARVEVLCRRGYGKKNTQIVIDDLTLDLGDKSVKRGNEHVELTAREYRTLEYLAVRRGEVVSKQEIESHVYDDQADLMSNVVESTVCDLRKKISSPGAPSVIQTRRGFGYTIGKPE